MVELLPGEEICPACKGEGKGDYNKTEDFFDFFCFRCNGTGKIDWVQKAMGPQKRNPYDKITLPILRKTYPKLLAEDLCPVQPLEMPELVKEFKKNE
jgi:hypothetical protein